MRNSNAFINRVKSLIFINVKVEALDKLFDLKTSALEEVYVPLRSERVITKINSKESLDDIPLSFLIEGMFYVIAADENFKHNDVYKQMLEGSKNAITIIKKIIYEEIKQNNLEDAYLLLKGLCKIELDNDNFDKLLMLCNEIRLFNKDFETELESIIEILEVNKNYKTPYLYKAILFKERGNYIESLSCIDEYVKNCREVNSSVSKLHKEISIEHDYSKGKELVYDEPMTALKYLLPLIEVFEDDAVLYYYIAVAYRKMDNYEKAIYYLNEAVSIDDAIVEVINELGINYSCLGMYQEALKYFRKAFDVTKSVEICTNIIMCYLQLGETEQARLHLEIAGKLNQDDELLIKFHKLLEGEK